MGERSLGLTWTLPGEWNSDDWRHRAACRHSDPDLFFPVGVTGAAAVVQTEAAKAVCGWCPVRSDCLEFALVTNQEVGVWGGAGEEERRTLRRARRELQGGSPVASAQQAVELAPDDAVALT